VNSIYNYIYQEKAKKQPKEVVYFGIAVIH